MTIIRNNVFEETKLAPRSADSAAFPGLLMAGSARRPHHGSAVTDGKAQAALKNGGYNTITAGRYTRAFSIVPSHHRQLQKHQVCNGEVPHLKTLPFFQPGMARTEPGRKEDPQPVPCHYLNGAYNHPARFLKVNCLDTNSFSLA